jgi:hypothetical protein
MSKQYQLRIDVLNMLLRFMVTLTILSMLLLPLTNNETYVWRLLILFPAAVISLIIDKGTKHIWSYIILHLLLLAIYLFLTDDLILRIVYGAYIIVCAIIQFALGLKKKVQNTTLAFSVVFLAMYSACRYQYSDGAALSRFFFYIAVAYGLIYILNMYFINMHVYLQKHKDKSNVPLKQIRASNRVYIIAFVYLCFISMMAFTKFPLDKLLHFLGQCIIKFLRFVFSGLSKKPAEEYVPEDIIPEPEINMENPALVPADEPSEFWQHLYQIVTILVMAASVCMILILLVYGLYRIYKLYYQKKVSTDGEEKVEVISPFSESGLSFFKEIGPVRRKFLNLFVKSNNDKIRGQYLRAVQKRTKPEQNLKYETPAEISKHAIAPDSKLTQEGKGKKETALTALYEKARYSNEECSREEVQSVKNLLK